MNKLDEAYIHRINQDARIIKSSKMDWSVDEVNRFVALLKVENVIGQTLKIYEIDGSKLFDLQFLQMHLSSVLNQILYMPMYKLYMVVKGMINNSKSQQQRMTELFKSKSKGHQKIAFATTTVYKNINIDEQVIIKLQQRLQGLNNTPIIELGCSQVIKMLKSSAMDQLSQLCKKYNIDGFSLVCILPSEHEFENIRNYFPDQDINQMMYLSDIFIHLYFYQHYYLNKIKKEQPTMCLLDDPFNVEFQDLNFYKNSQRGSLVQSQYGNIQEMAVANSVRGSLAQSAYGVSQQGSVRHSMAESIYASSEIMDEDNTRSTQKKNELNDIRISSIEDDTILKSLSVVTLKLPFNLLNLQPLQKIKISLLPYPFHFLNGKGLVKKQSKNQNFDNISDSKIENIYEAIQTAEGQPQFKIFNLSGAKFGRNAQNDFSYPDELSISGKHAQIIFKEQSYFIRDLGSKTGTFVYISDLKPLVLQNDQYIQLSYEIQLKVKILKNDINEGIIKFQFKKPDNQPAYRAILKNNNIIRIGKSENSHIRLTNQSISSKHAEIKYQQGKFILYGFNTPTGTWLRLSNKGVKSLDRRLTEYDIFRISSKKTFLVNDITGADKQSQAKQKQKVFDSFA